MRNHLKETTLYKFLGWQDVPWGRPIDLYNLKKGVPGHPRGSTISRETLIMENLIIY